MRIFKILSILTIKSHKYLLILGLVSLYIYSVFLLYSILFKLKDAGNALQLSSFLIQSGMLFFMLLGFQIARKNSGAMVLYKTIKGGIIKVLILNIVLLLLIITVFVFSLIIITNLYYFHLNPSNHFYFESSAFLINNLLLPYFIAGLIGYIVGANSRSTFSYAYLILIWALLSPTNQNFVNNLLSNAQLTEGFSLLHNLNLGVQDMNAPYQPFYGFQLYWAKKVIYILILLGICFLSIFAATKQRLQRINIASLLFTLVIFSLIPYSSNNINYLDGYLDEYDFYEKQHKIPDKDLFDYKIESFKVAVKNYEKFSVDLEMEVNNIKTSKIAFTLYKGFRITKINDSNGINLRFEQMGDFTIVNLPLNFIERTMTLNIQYTGNGTLANPATQNKVFLPSDFSWIPANKMTPTHFVFNEHVIPNKLSSPEPIKFKLTYEGKEKLDYVNLKQIDGSVYEGEATGLTLIGGDLTQRKKDDHNIYYPKSWFSYENELDKYLLEFEKMISNYNNLFKTNYKLPKNIVLLPSMAINDSYIFTFTSSTKEQLIIQLDPVKLTKKRPLNTTIPYQMVFAFNNNKNFEGPEQFANWLVFNSFLGANLDNDFENKSSFIFKQYQQLVAEPYISEKDKPIYNKLLKYNNTKLPNEFLIKWKSLLEDDEENDWEQLEELLKTTQMEVIQ
jgi:hypothetical protein